MSKLTDIFDEYCRFLKFSIIFDIFDIVDSWFWDIYVSLFRKNFRTFFIFLKLADFRRSKAKAKETGFSTIYFWFRPFNFAKFDRTLNLLAECSALVLMSYTRPVNSCSFLNVSLILHIQKFKCSEKGIKW